LTLIQEHDSFPRLRRSRSDDACDLLEPFIRNSLKDFDFVVDDMHNLYSKSDLDSVTDFLDIYRYEKIDKEENPATGQ
jgi:hypothetical protein